jgi:hypothetical protein
MCFKGYCTGVAGCHTNTLSLYRCEGASCVTNLDCESSKCVGKTCSYRSDCATDESAFTDKCEGVMCVSASECKVFGGY